MEYFLQAKVWDWRSRSEGWVNESLMSFEDRDIEVEEVKCQFSSLFVLFTVISLSFMTRLSIDYQRFRSEKKKKKSRNGCVAMVSALSCILCPAAILI